MKHKTKAFGFELKSLDESSGKFAGYGSVFHNVDSYGDVVVKGAFAQSLERWKSKGKLPKMLWQHRASEPIGTWTSMVEDDHGLYCEGRVLLEAGPTEQRAFAHLKAGSIEGLSIGFMVPPGGSQFDGKSGVTLLSQIDLMEVSLVTFPANEAAQVDSVKAALHDPREMENLLREAGLTAQQAKSLIEGGFGALNPASHDVGGKAAIEQAVKAIDALTQRMTA